MGLNTEWVFELMLETGLAPSRVFEIYDRLFKSRVCLLIYTDNTLCSQFSCNLSFNKSVRLLLKGLFNNLDYHEVFVSWFKLCDITSNAIMTFSLILK